MVRHFHWNQPNFQIFLIGHGDPPNAIPDAVAPHQRHRLGFCNPNFLSASFMRDFDSNITRTKSRAIVKNL